MLEVTPVNQVEGYREPPHTGKSAVSTNCGDRSSRNRSSVEKSSDVYRSLEDLAPLAMQRIEALALEGLKVQSEMAEEEAPFSFVAREGSFRR